MALDFADDTGDRFGRNIPEFEYFRQFRCVLFFGRTGHEWAFLPIIAAVARSAQLCQSVRNTDRRCSPVNDQELTALRGAKLNVVDGGEVAFEPHGDGADQANDRFPADRPGSRACRMAVPPRLVDWSA